MKKNQIIDYINKNYESGLDNSNTSYSSINKSKSVWWFTISLSKFNSGFNLLLEANENVLWLYLPKGFVKDISASFKIRLDRNAVDLEISAEKNFKFLKDIKSGGTEFDFTFFFKRKN